MVRLMMDCRNQRIIANRLNSLHKTLQVSRPYWNSKISWRYFCLMVRNGNGLYSLHALGLERRRYRQWVWSPTEDCGEECIELWQCEDIQYSKCWYMLFPITIFYAWLEVILYIKRRRNREIDQQELSLIMTSNTDNTDHLCYHALLFTNKVGLQCAILNFTITCEQGSPPTSSHLACGKFPFCNTPTRLLQQWLSTNLSQTQWIGDCDDLAGSSCSIPEMASSICASLESLRPTNAP